MLGRSSARDGRPTELSHSRLRSVGATPAARGLAAAVVAVAALITAANAVPAHAARQAPAVTREAPAPGSDVSPAGLPLTHP